ncbi:unnamed protein product [Diatraea saccharalis]|uniref:Uncharacterized protein n=1 Tax=Diatraea saccharalis TaxID=40085 RepID=A0A9N9WG32_9NEOP|nr:unnamed protein product [Diatraea saccharalis]
MGKKKGKSKSSKQTFASGSTKEAENFSHKDNDMDIIAAAISAANQVVFLKVCRLCESKDGPFLNIFDPDKITAKKIDELMPFAITENDDLPHKICFRCSAKVEELHEFLQKCIKTQNSLRSAMGKKEPLAIKPKTRTLWEEKLNKSNMSNDDICDALIKKAMEGIKDKPLNENSLSANHKKDTKQSPVTTVAPKNKKIPEDTSSIKIEEEELEKSSNDKKVLSDSPNDSKFIPTRASRSKKSVDNLLDGLEDMKRKKMTAKQNDQKPTDDASVNKNKGINDLSFDYDDSYLNNKINRSNINPTPQEETKEEAPAAKPKPFDIMDHVSMIKVHGVGVLFQCKLCNRNFLKKELVMSHGCAKTGVPRVDFTKNLVPPAPPKVPVVKYINTKIDDVSNKPPIENKSETVKKAPLDTKPKPKIGPASKVKKQDNEYGSVIGMTVIPMEQVSSPSQKVTPPTPVEIPNNITPSVQFPTIPSLNSRYKLVPGPNNTYQLVEEPVINSEPEPEKPVDEVRKRKSDPPKALAAKTRRQNSDNDKSKQKSSEVIHVDNQPVKPAPSGAQPYPVGLFQTRPHHSGIFTAPVPPEAPFTTPAMKKQSYTVVQTGNPSKLLISSKPQVVPEEAPKRKTKKSKPEVKTNIEDKQPFTVTLEDETPPKDSGFFTFINVDPLLQPSYVLPTDNIIQESQISTSTPASKTAIDNKEKDKYSCNMCSETFSREKKLLTHIQSHYNKMDEEDQMRADKNTRKRSGRKN